jgi:hypothetical protein
MTDPTRPKHAQCGRETRIFSERGAQMPENYLAALMLLARVRPESVVAYDFRIWSEKPGEKP